MFCQNCGAELTDESQKFCQSCGSEIHESPEEIQKAPEPTPESPISSPTPSLEPTPISTKKPISVETPYSKKTLIFSIVSLAVAVITMIVAFNIFILGRFMPFTLFSNGLNIPRIIGIVSFYILGLVFGIVSRTNSSKADAEPENTMEKIGSVLGILGIIINAIPMVITIIIPLVRFNPFYFL